MRSIKELLNFGIVLIDKPSGPTSFSVSDYVRKKLKLKKTSHFGTLDPKVTGMLPIALGRACRLTGFFLGHDKEYMGILHTHIEWDMKKLQKVIDDNFVGKIKQTPPVKSRVKRAERVREVKRWELLEQNGKDFLFVAEVEGGTYIRKLCSDLGELIEGAHMIELRRIRAGIFSEDDTKFVRLDKFDEIVKDEKELEKIIVPAEEAIKRIMPFVQVKKAVVKHLLTGKPLFRKDVDKIPEEDDFAVFCKDDFVGIYAKSAEKEIVGRARFVFN